MDPNTLDETVQNSFLGNIYEPLVRRNRKLEPEPALAASYEQTSPTVWRFHLRPGVKWQDGTAFTADDVLFSYRRITSKTSNTSSNVVAVAKVNRIDDLTVDFETKGPDPILPSEFTNWPILPKAWMEKNGSADPVIIGQGENFALRNAMGTGPFVLTSREADRRNVLSRNPTWWEKPEHNLDRVEFNVIGNAATRVAALLSGEVDMIYSVPPQNIDAIGKAPGVRIIQGPELRTIYLGMDQTRDELLFSSVKGKNPFKGRARPARAGAGDRRGGDHQPRDARTGRADLGDVGAGRERLQPGPERATEGRSGGGEEAAGGGGLSRRLHGDAGLPERPLHRGRGDLHRDRGDGGAHRRQGERVRAHQGEVLHRHRL